MSFFWNSRVVTGPRERSSSRPRYFMAGQSRMVAVWRTALVPIAGDELLDGLQGVEDAGGGGGGEGEAFAVGDDGVALGLHLVGHCGMRVEPEGRQSV